MRRMLMQRARDAFARSSGSTLVTVIGVALLVGPLSCAESEDDLAADRRDQTEDDGASVEGTRRGKPVTAPRHPDDLDSVALKLRGRRHGL